LSELEEVYDMINEGKAGVIVEEWKKYSVTLGKEVVKSTGRSSTPGLRRM